MVDWVSVSKVNEYLYKPDIGVCMVERARSVYKWWCVRMYYKEDIFIMFLKLLKESLQE